MSNKDYLIKVLASYIETLNEAASTNELHRDKYTTKIKRIKNVYTDVLLMLQQNSSDNLELNYDLENLMTVYPIIK